MERKPLDLMSSTQRQVNLLKTIAKKYPHFTRDKRPFAKNQFRGIFCQPYTNELSKKRINNKGTVVLLQQNQSCVLFLLEYKINNFQ